VLVVSATASAACVVRTVTLPPLENVAVRGFVLHAEREWPAAPSGAQTVDTLDWMITAVESLANNRRIAVDDLSVRVRHLRTLMKEFATINAESVERTRVLRRVFSDGAVLIGDLAFAAGVDAVKPADLRRAAESLDLNQVPGRQADRIERYFQAASEALQHIDRGA
jgi:hypothetical protein